MDIKGKYKKLSLPARAALWFTVCNFVLKGISFITGPIFTRLLPSDEYGTLSIFLSYEQLILIFATWEIQLGAYQRGIFKYSDDVDFFTTSAQALTNILTIACFVVIFIFNKIITRITEMPISILILLFIYLLFRPAYNEWLTRRRKAYDYKAGVAVTLLYSIANVLVPMAALLVVGRTANVKFGFTLAISSIICLLLYYKHANYWTIPQNWEKTKQYWKFCLVFEGPLVLHSLSYLVLSQADRVMIKEMIGSSQAAFYAVAYSIASVVSLFQSSVNTSLSPWRFQMLDEHRYQPIKDITNKLLIAFGLIIIMFILVVPEMMKILFPSDYLEAVWCIPPISTGVFFMFLYSIFVNIEEYYEQTKYVVIVSVTCGIINIVLNYIFIQLFGYIACAYTTLFCYILFSLGHYHFMKKTLIKEGISESVVDARAIIFISIIVLCLSIIITLLYDRAILRYALFLCLLTLLFIKRESITELFKQMKNR